MDNLSKLQQVVIEAIEYVGSANYQVREDAAKNAVYLAFRAYRKNEPDNIKFSIPEVLDDEH